MGPVLAAAIVLTAPLLVPAAPAAAAVVPGTGRAHQAASEAETTPLSVTLTSITPSTIPRKGVVVLSGTVSNDSEEDWTDINVAPFVSGEPITTRDALSKAAATPASDAVGERLTDFGDAVGDLAPGGSVAFRLRVPVSALNTAPGVYWIGAHALGANATGRDLVADGRARTFIPLVTPQLARRNSVPVSITLPLRERARRAADGSLNGPTRWVNLTKTDGKLARLVDFGASAGPSPVTWLVDPATLDALEDFGNGNPPLSLANPRSTGGTGSTGSSGNASPSPAPPPRSGAPDEEERIRAKAVLATFVATARSHTLLTLGYSDPDVGSLARRRPVLIKRSDQLAAGRMKARGLLGTPVVAPPSGYFDPALLAEVPPESLVILSDHGRLQSPAASRLSSGQELVLTDARASAGGPAPTAALDPLALRQRILSEAALEVTRGGTPGGTPGGTQAGTQGGTPGEAQANEPIRPVVVTLPISWDPGPDWAQADFFGGLRTPWVQLVPVPRGSGTAYDGELAYGRTQLAQEIPMPNVTATRALNHTSKVLGTLLANETTVTDRLSGAALQASSYSARPTLKLAADQVSALDATTRGLMDRVQVTGTDFVTLSGGSGQLTVTLVNDLKQPITVGLEARTDDPGVRVETPGPVNMQAGQRSTLRLQVSSGVGVHDVTLYPVTTAGDELGTPLTFSLRTSQVGRLIWYIIIAGAVLLAVMIVRRIVIRVRSHRWRQAEG